MPTEELQVRTRINETNNGHEKRNDRQTFPATRKRSTNQPHLPLETLLSTMNQMIACIVNERLTEIAERAGIIEQDQGGFRQGQRTDIHNCQLYGLLYGLSLEAQRLKKRFFRAWGLIFDRWVG